MATTASIPPDAAAHALRSTMRVLAGLAPSDPPGLLGTTRTVEHTESTRAVRDLVASQELERRRIARDLHDVVGQALTSVKLTLEAMRRDADDPGTEAEFREGIALVDQAMRDVRDIAFDLRPSILDDLGLVAALRWQLARQARLAGYRSVFRAEQVGTDLGVEVESACFRTLQEALTNVARHAGATCVRVTLSQSRTSTTLSIDDDGVGFEVPRARTRGSQRPTLGLLGIAERIALVGGRFSIDSRPGHGTRIRARFPLSSSDPRSDGRS